MTARLHWAATGFRITADIDFPRRVDLVAEGDFSGIGAAVLLGALARVTRLRVPVRVDASSVTALSPDAERALAHRVTHPAEPLIVDYGDRPIAALSSLRRPAGARARAA